ncbi:hypothetical protein EON78_06435, partial [bacterium]
MGKLIGQQNLLWRKAEILEDIHKAEFQVFSQWGDDGIIHFLVNYLDIPNQTFVEFGVENYTECNTRFLLVNDNWSGLIMDGSSAHMSAVRNESIYWRYDLKAVDTFVTAENINDLLWSNGFAGEIGLLYAFDELNVNDTLFEAYQSQYPNLSETKSLFDKVIEAHCSGESSFGGLVSGVKGKLYEINLQETLNTNYPDWNFSIAENANQPIWDLIGIGPEGQEILVQAKMGAASYAFDVKERMLDNPDVLFATSREIHEKILESSPELAAQFIDVDVSNIELTDEVSSGLEQLLANHGVDVPDGIGDLLPFVGEIVAGIKLLVELSKVNQDFDKVDISDKRRIQGLRAIMAFSKFGISSVISIA